MDVLMSSRSTLVYLLAGLVGFCLVAARFRRRPRYPPGPKGLPIIGNLFDVPVDYPWLKYIELGQQYESDLIHFEVFGSHIVVLNSMKATKDLLEKRSNKYSSRQQTVMLHELSGWHRMWILMEYGDYWRKHRKLFHQHFRPLAVPQYHSSQTKAIRRLLPSLLDSPGEFMGHIRFMAGAMILDIAYAISVRPGDPLIKLVEKAMHSATEIIASGVYLVDVIPILKRLPSWFPGAGFKRQTAKWRPLVDSMFETPYGQFKESMREGNAKPCFAATLLSSVNNNEDATYLDQIFMSLAGSVYGAGSDTTISTLTTFIQAITMFPETQISACAELDRVLSRKRLPEIEDQDSLPCITAIVHEVLRWHPVVPLAVPHQTIADDEYRGYHIPAGTVVIGNTWAILHDEDVFPDPEAFKPERFLREDGSLRDDMPYPVEAFGYGIATILAVFKVERAVDEHRNVIEPKGEFTPRFLSMPKPFKCRFTPRFPEAETLIRSAALAD